MSGRSGGMILLGIIALAGLGLSGYMFLKYEFLSPTKDSGLILVGLWDNLNENLDYTPHDSTSDFLVELNASPFNDSAYVSVSHGNTRFVLKKAGFYKITLNILFQAIGASYLYLVYLLRNSDINRTFARIAISANPDDTWYYLQASQYIYSNGIDFFQINCLSTEDSYFIISNSNQYNQLSIEYVMQ